MKYEEIVADLKAGKYAPIYFLSGEESYFLDDIATRIEKNALTEDEKAFNQTILYGNDVSMTTVTDTARRFPMMTTSSCHCQGGPEYPGFREFTALY